jgi:hypothetical protein
VVFPAQDIELFKGYSSLYDEHEEEYREVNGNTKGFNKVEYPFEHEWKITHDGITIDDIGTCATLRRGRTKVYIGYLGDGEDFFVTAKSKKALEKFLKDFELEEEILKDEKVVQLS